MSVNTSYILLGAHIVKIFILVSDSIYHPINFCEKKFDLNKMQSFLEALIINVQICRHFGSPWSSLALE